MEIFTPTPGRFYDELPAEQYFTSGGISASDIKTALRSPAHYRAARLHPRPSTPAQAFGTAFHSFLLEPDKFKADYSISEYSDFRGKEAREWRNAQIEAGKKVISGVDDESDPYWKPSDYSRLCAMRDAVMTHPYASLFFLSYAAERSVYWRDKSANGECLARCRIDLVDFAHNLFVDLKTAGDASYSAFARSVVDYSYHLSAAWYLRAGDVSGITPSDYAFLVVERDPPYAVAVYTLDRAALALGATLVSRGLDTLTRAISTDVFNSYPPEPRAIELPPWAQRQPIS